MVWGFGFCLGFGVGDASAVGDAGAVWLAVAAGVAVTTDPHVGVALLLLAVLLPHAVSASARASTIIPVMMTLRPILVMFVPPLTTRDAIDVTPAARATKPYVLSRSPSSPVVRHRDGTGSLRAVTVICLCHMRHFGSRCCQGPGERQQPGPRVIRRRSMQRSLN